MKRIKLVGKSSHLRVVDAETEDVITGVSAVFLNAEAGSQPVLTLFIKDFDCNIDFDSDDITIEKEE